ncbi:MAG: AAA family ATPase, partial [Leptolinea sp.]
FVEQLQQPIGHPLWVLFDEVQYAKDWEIQLEFLISDNPHIRFVVCGSVITLHNIGRPSNTSSFTEFFLPPVTFAEYLRFTGQEDTLIIYTPKQPESSHNTYHSSDIHSLNAEFVRYLNYGGFPEMVMDPAMRANPARFLRQGVDKVLLNDLPNLYGIGDIQELNRFFSMLAFNTGIEVGMEELSKYSGISKSRLSDYLDYLEAAFLIKRVYRVDNKNSRMRRERTFKVFLSNPSIRSAIFGMVTASEDAIVNLAETAVWSQLMHSNQKKFSLHYARWKEGRQDLEVSMVSLDVQTNKLKFVVEIRWSDQIPDTLNDLPGLQSLVSKNAFNRKPLVTTRTITDNITLDDCAIEFMPLALHCYIVSRNLLDSGLSNIKESGYLALSETEIQSEYDDTDIQCSLRLNADPPW